MCACHCRRSSRCTSSYSRGQNVCYVSEQRKRWSPVPNSAFPLLISLQERSYYLCGLPFRSIVYISDCCFMALMKKAEPANIQSCFWSLLLIWKLHFKKSSTPLVINSRMYLISPLLPNDITRGDERRFELFCRNSRWNMCSCWKARWISSSFEWLI